MNIKPYQLKRNRGFTMAELIIVIAILAVLIVYLVRNFGVRSDDAKVAMVSNILSKDVPAAFQAFILENNGCLSPDTNDTNIGNILSENNAIGNANNAYDSSAERTGIKLLLDNGVPAGTPWNNAAQSNSIQTRYAEAYTVWSAEFVAAAGQAGAYLEVTYPLTGAGNVARAQQLLQEKLQNSSEIHSIDGITATGGVDRPDIPAAAAAAAGTLMIRYACS